MLFSELYSAYYNAVAAILKEAASKPLSPEELRAIAKKHAFGESFLTIEDALKSGNWHLLSKDGSSLLSNVPDMPLTTLEKRWLKAISLDKRIRLFGDIPDFPDFPEVTPLFTDEDYRIFDRYSDGDDYEDAGYIARFRMICAAIKNRQRLYFSVVNRYGKIRRTVALPEYLEYSEKDDKFRLVVSGGGGKKSFLNLSRILSCTESDKIPQATVQTASKRNSSRLLVLEITDERKALERVMLHFAHFEKEAEKQSDGKYKVKLKYDVDDETEMVIRVLSFGPLVRVVSPQSFTELIKNRLMMQKNCGLF